MYLDNVYVRGATKVLADPAHAVGWDVDVQSWLRICRYAHPARPQTDQGREYRYPVYVDGRPVEHVCELQAGESPPADLQTRHLWSPRFPSFESPGAANVKTAAYGARGDGRADDTQALQRAIDENEIVFLPKGCYRLTRTLELRPNTKLIGLGVGARWQASRELAVRGTSERLRWPIVGTGRRCSARLSIVAFRCLLPATGRRLPRIRIPHKCSGWL